MLVRDPPAEINKSLVDGRLARVPSTLNAASTLASQESQDPRPSRARSFPSCSTIIQTQVYQPSPLLETSCRDTSRSKRSKLLYEAGLSEEAVQITPIILRASLSALLFLLFLATPQLYFRPPPRRLAGKNLRNSIKPV